MIPPYQFKHNTETKTAPEGILLSSAVFINKYITAAYKSSLKVSYNRIIHLSLYVNIF
jgi:hypothetical protein